MAFRQQARRLVLGACAALLLTPVAAGGDASGWQQGVERFAEEKTLAEGCASLLKSFAGHDPMARVQGRRLYGRARADVDGLIALLKADLGGERSPAAIPELKYRLEAVARQRQTFCRHVEAAIGAAARRRPGPSPGLFEQGIADGSASLVDAAVLIWEGHRFAGHAERERMVSALEGARWRDYAEIPPGLP